MENCLFCSMVAGKIPVTKVYEDELVLAFRDIAPQAPTHVLVIPKTHLSGMAEADQADPAVLAACLRACAIVARQEGIEQTGYRIVSNVGADACQSVPHLHFHVLGGRKMSDSMA